MDSKQRNVMLGYAVVSFLSLIGVCLNLVAVFNLNSIDKPQMTQDIATGLKRGFLTIATIYLLVVICALAAIIKKNYSKRLLIILIIILLVSFVFGQYIFDFYLEPETL